MTKSLKRVGKFPLVVLTGGRVGIVLLSCGDDVEGFMF